MESTLTQHVRSSLAMEVPSDSSENAISTGIVPPSVERYLHLYGGNDAIGGEIVGGRPTLT